MKESLKENEYKVSQTAATTRSSMKRKAPSIQSYSRLRPYGRDSITATDPLQRLKDIAGYENPPRSQSITIFDPETIQSGTEGAYVLVYK